MSDLLIPSFLMVDVSELLRLLTKNEGPWAIRSGLSPKMSNHEQIAQVAHQKWANEQIASFFEQIAHMLIFWKKWAICSENRWANSQPCILVTFWKYACTVLYAYLQRRFKHLKCPLKNLGAIFLHRYKNYILQLFFV